MPDWRREVSRKVREYGEKKKILTTPPNPLKENAEAISEADGLRPVDAAPPAPDSSLQAQRAKIITAALARVEPPEPTAPAAAAAAAVPPPPQPAPEPAAPPVHAAATSSVSVDPPPAAVKSRPLSAMVEPAALQPILPPQPMDRAPVFQENEIVAGDLDTAITLEDFQETPGDEEPQTPAYFARRTGAAIVDHTILVLLHAGLLYICAEIMNLRFWNFLSEAWMPVAGIFLLFHCLYFLYFYKTSRQTPGMVFFGIELRDPNSGYIPARRILARWMAFVLLNVLNLVPLFLGRNYLVLDALSGTQIRTLK